MDTSMSLLRPVKLAFLMVTGIFDQLNEGKLNISRSSSSLLLLLLLSLL